MTRPNRIFYQPKKGTVLLPNHLLSLSSSILDLVEIYVKRLKWVLIQWCSLDFRLVYLIIWSLCPSFFLVYIIIFSQLAYNKLTGQYVGTYESCSTAAFKHGRTETMRPCTMATKEFCESLKRSESAKPQMLKEILSNCSKIHVKLLKEAAMGVYLFDCVIQNHPWLLYLKSKYVLTGEGFDRHLFGLRKLAEKKGRALPGIYQDPAYAYINHHILSTSTLSSDVVALGGFGPVVKNGLGIG